SAAPGGCDCASAGAVSRSVRRGRKRRDMSSGSKPGMRKVAPPEKGEPRPPQGQPGLRSLRRARGLATAAAAAVAPAAPALALAAVAGAVAALGAPLAHRLLLLLRRLGEERLPGEPELSVVADLDELDLHLVAHLHHVLGLLDVAVGHLGDVEHGLLARQDLEDRAEGEHVLDRDRKRVV